MRKALSVLMLLWSMGRLFAADPASAGPEWIDPVILENAHVKAVVDRGRGATLRSLQGKADGMEAAREFRTSHGWSGALAEDRLAGDGYPGAITRLTYTGELVRAAGAQVLRLHCLPPDAKYAGLEFFKTFTLPDDAAYVMVDWEIVNRGTTAQAVTPWVHNIVGKHFRNTLLPRPDGIALIAPSADYFHDPVRNWLGGYDPESGQLITFCADFSQMLKQYYCYWNGYHTLEWTYQPAPLAAGGCWSSWYSVGVGRSAAAPAVALPEATASASWQPEGLQIDVTWNCLLENLQLQPLFPGQETATLPRQTVQTGVGATSRLLIPAAQIPATARSVRLELWQDERKLARREFKGAGNHLEIDIDPAGRRGADTLPPQTWPPPQSPYLSIQPRQLPAMPVASQGPLQLWEVSPLDKIFEQDAFVASGEPAAAVSAAIRNSRFFRQAVVHNGGREPLVVRVDGDSLALACGPKRLPVTLRLVGYVATTEPSGFTMKYPVGRYPDPLLPMPESFTVAPGHSQPLWLEGVVPADQASGLYAGNVRLHGPSGELVLPVSCQVTALTLPARSALRTTIGCWSLADTLLKEVGYAGSSAQFQALCRELYYQHRLTPRENGVRWTFDARLDAQLQELRDRHVTSIMIPGMISNHDANLDRAVDSLRRNGLFAQAFCYMQDEAPADRFPEVIESCQRLHARHPDLKLLGTIYEKDVSPLYGHIQIWCRDISSEPWQKERKLAGDEFMSSNLPGVALERDGHEIVVPFLQLHYHGYSGFLFWNMIGGYRRDNPWKNILCAGQNGNAHLLYPHASGPLETIRWEHMYVGVELFDLLSLLQERQPERYAAWRPRLENPATVAEVLVLRQELIKALENR